MLLNNPCINDSRVIKAAESLAEAGYDVSVFCRAAPHAGASTTHNGVTYRRICIPPYRLRAVVHFVMEHSALGVVVSAHRRVWRVAAVLAFSPALILVLPFMRLGTQGSGAGRRGRIKRAIDIVRRIANVLTDGAIQLIQRLRSVRSRAGAQWKSIVRRSEYIHRLLRYVNQTVGAPLRLIIQRGLLNIQLSFVGLMRFIVRALRFMWRVFRQVIRRMLRIIKRARQYLVNTLFLNKWGLQLLQPICSYNIFKWAMCDPVCCWRPHVIHAHDLVALPAAIDIARKTDAQVIYDAHEFATLEIENEFRLATFYKRYTERRLVKQINGMITVSDGFSRIFAELYNIEPPVVIYNTPRFDPHDAMNRDVRSDLGFDPSVPLGVYIGGLNPRRALRQLVESLAYAPEMHIAKVGARNSQYEAMIEEAAAEFGVRNRLHLLDDVPPEQIVHYIRTGDFGIVTRIKFSLQQDYSMPNKLFESVFGGLPIIAGDVREIRDFLARFEVGVLMNSLDPKDIARAIREVYARRDELRPTPEKQQAIAGEFGWPAQQGKMLALYQRVMADRSTVTA